MSFAITGLTNANEFYSQHYLDEILEKDLKPLFDQWKEQGAQSPVARLRTAAGANGYFRARERFLNERKTSERASLFIDLVQPLLTAVGYELAPQNLALAEGELPVLAVYRDAKHQPLLVIAAAIANAEDDDSSPLHAEVVHKAFRGADILYTLRLAGGARVLSLVPSHHNHAIGERIGIRLDVDHVVTFPLEDGTPTPVAHTESIAA